MSSDRKRVKVPAIKRHPNGQAYVYHRSIDRPGHVLYLGPHGSEQSLRRYRAFLSRLEANQAVESAPVLLAFPCSTVGDLIAAYLQHCETYYRHPDGRNTSEFSCMKEAMRPMLALFQDEPIREFNVDAFETYRNRLVVQGYARTTINSHTGRVRRMFRWASQKGYVSASVWHSLAAVEGLKKGRTNAVESPQLGAVTWEEVQVVLPYLSPVVAAMVQVQFWCGMRPQDVCRMQPRDLERSGEVWLYTPREHKSSWRGHTLVKAVPQFVQPLISGRLREQTDYVFSPREAVDFHAERKASQSNRTTRQQRERKRKTATRKHRDHYTSDTYRQAVMYGFDRLNEAVTAPIKAWTPLQLRHGIATYLERTLGRQAAQRYLGHRHLATTEIYVEKDAAEVIAIALAIQARQSPT